MAKDEVDWWKRHQKEGSSWSGEARVAPIFEAKERECFCSTFWQWFCVRKYSSVQSNHRDDSTKQIKNTKTIAALKLPITKTIWSVPLHSTARKMLAALSSYWRKVECSISAPSRHKNHACYWIMVSVRVRISIGAECKSIEYVALLQNRHHAAIAVSSLCQIDMLYLRGLRLLMMYE